MFPWLRLLCVGLTLDSESKVDLFATTRVRLRVWPNDLDVNGHVNNGRYLTLADIGRIHWFMCTGLFALARRHKTYPVVGDAIAKFRRDLKVFQSFEIHTRLIGWDAKWGFLEHRFIRAERVIGVVAVRGAFKGSGGTIDLGTLLQDLSDIAASPELPEWAARFCQSGELLSESLRAEERLRGLRDSKS